MSSLFFSLSLAISLALSLSHSLSLSHTHSLLLSLALVLTLHSVWKATSKTQLSVAPPKGKEKIQVTRKSRRDSIAVSIAHGQPGFYPQYPQ